MSLGRSFRAGKLSSSQGQELRTEIGRARLNSIKNEANELSKYKEFIDIVSSTPEYAIALYKKVDSAEMDHLAKSLLNLCCYTNTTMCLIHKLLQDEFTNNQVNTILRGNSLATKVETAFSRLVGQKYIKELFGDIILRLVTDIGLNLATTLGKLDEEGVKAEVRVEENRQRVTDVAQEFVDRFTSDEMVDKMPRALRAIAYFTAHFAKIYTPERVLPFLGGFILLRFFNPAIITPESLNMLPEGISPSNQDRQNFIAITRLLQKLSNQVFASESEDQVWIRPFLERNSEKMKIYFEKVIKDSININGDFSDLLKNDKELYPEQKLNIKNVVLLHNLIFENGNYILQELSKYPPIERGGKEIILSAEFIKMMLSLDSSPRSNKMDLLTKKSLFLPAMDITQEGTLLKPRMGQSISVINHFAYIFGGSYIDGSLITGKDSLLVYNLSSSTWTSEGSDSIPPRKHHTSVSYNGSIIIFGGLSNTCLNDMYKYDIVAKKWSVVHYGNEAPLPRYGHTMQVYEDHLYIFGGYCFDGKRFFYTNAMIKFDLRSNTWTNIVVSYCPSERMHHASVLYNSSIWIVGGRTPQMEGLGDLYQYDIKKNEWKHIHFQGDPPPSRWSHSLNVSLKKMIVFGGCNERETLDDAYEFSFNSLTWERLDYSSPFGVRNYQLSDHSAAIFNGVLITMFGGTFALDGKLTNKTYQLAFDVYYSPPSTLSQDFSAMLNNSFMSDASLIVGESTIYVHKLILSVRCPTLFTMIENANNVLRLEGASEANIHLLLSFLYTGHIDTSLLGIKTISCLIPLCFKLDIPELVRILELRLVKKVNERSILELISYAEKYYLRILELECIKWFKTSTPDVSAMFPFEKCSNRVLCLIGNQIFPQSSRSSYDQ